MDAASGEKFILLVDEKKIGFWCKLSSLCEVGAAKGQTAGGARLQSQAASALWLVVFRIGLQKMLQLNERLSVDVSSLHYQYRIRLHESEQRRRKTMEKRRIRFPTSRKSGNSMKGESENRPSELTDDKGQQLPVRARKQERQNTRLLVDAKDWNWQPTTSQQGHQ